MSENITVMVNGKPVSAIAGTVLSEIVAGEKPCGGHGKCGKCRVRVKGRISKPGEEERSLLSEEEFADGVRLACLTYALGDCEVELLSGGGKLQIETDGVLPEFVLHPSFAGYGLAIDIGTTTLAARLYDVKGKPLSETSRPNPQAEWGADVISRIEAAMSGKAELLAGAIRGALNRIIIDSADAANIRPEQIDGVCITGNTAMLHLLVNEPTEPLSRAPFEAGRLFGEKLSAEALDLSCLRPDTRVYLPPCISAFVGADITCAILATRLCGGDTAVLVDIGTNGEMALWHDGRLTVCSTAAGPAFEGVNISMGMRGALGAIDKVSLSDGELKAHVIGNGTPTGICGSGLIDAVACMLDAGIIDETGYLEEDQFVILAPVSLVPKDMRMVQLAKSAICAGMLTLIESRELSTADIASLHIAGGFGNYLNRKSAVRIGLLPSELAERVRLAGNAALSGASMLMLNSEFQAEAENLAQNAHVLNLSSNPVFSEHYTMGMLFEEV